jgi:signal peptidase I
VTQHQLTHDDVAGDEASQDAAEVPPTHEHHLNLLGVLQGLLTIVVVAVFVLTFVAQPFRIPSESMEPTLLIGDFVLVDKVALAPAGAWHWLLPYRNVRREDVVVFRKSATASAGGEDQDSYLVKRLVALPGDRLRLDDGRLLLNGVPQRETYAVFLPSGPDAFRDDFPASLYTDIGVESAWWVQMHRLVQNGALVVPERDYFALGDNRNHSQDSRYWGFVPRDQILGPVRIIYFSVRTPSPDDVELAQTAVGKKNPNDTMSRRGAENSGPDSVLNFARWDRIFRLVY